MRRTSLVLFAVGMITALVQAVAGQTASRPVAPEKLEALLPRLPGWERGEPSSEVITAGIAMSVARVNFDKDDLSLSLEITDTLSNKMLLGPVAPMLAAGRSGKTVEGVTARSFPVGGFTAVEVWDPRERVADALVVVNDRFLVKASQSDAKDTAAVRAALQAVNLSAIAALK